MRGGAAAVTPSHPWRAAGAPLRGGISDGRHGRRRGQLSRHQLSHRPAPPQAPRHIHHPGISAARNVPQRPAENAAQKLQCGRILQQRGRQQTFYFEEEGGYFGCCDICLNFFLNQQRTRTPPSFCCSRFTHLPNGSPQVSHHIVAQLLSRRGLGQSRASRTTSSITSIDDFRAAFI